MLLAENRDQRGIVIGLEGIDQRTHRLLGRGKLEDVVGAVAHTQSATDAGAEKIILGEGAWRTQGQCRQRLRLLGIQPEAEAEHADAAGHPRGIEEKLAPIGRLRRKSSVFRCHIRIRLSGGAFV